MFWDLTEDDADQSLLFSQLVQHGTVVDFQIDAIFLHKALPVKTGRDGRFVPERWLCLFIRHLEEDQVGELFHVIAIAHAIVAQHVAVVPDFLDDSRGFSCHFVPSSLVILVEGSCLSLSRRRDRLFRL